MDAERYMVFLNGEDRTDDIESFRVEEGQYGPTRYTVRFKTSRTEYTYNSNKIQVLEQRGEEDLTDRSVLVDGKPFYSAARLLDFGEYYRIVRKDGSMRTVPSDEVTVQYGRNGGSAAAKKPAKQYAEKPVKQYAAKPAGKPVPGPAKKPVQKQAAAPARNQIPPLGEEFLMEYFAQMDWLVSQEGDRDPLMSGYADDLAREGTVLASYLPNGPAPGKRELPANIIYPFGINLSQKQAVENALSSQVSIIQGPPGTGKTQTILNIIANAVFNGKTVAMVSNNNSAVQNVREKLAEHALDFLAANLGNQENQRRFLEEQTGKYPADMPYWHLRWLPRGGEKKQMDLFEELQRRGLAEDKRQLEKLEKSGMGYLAYCLRRKLTKAQFLEGARQGGLEMYLLDQIRQLVRENSELLAYENRIAGLRQEIAEVSHDRQYCWQYICRHWPKLVPVINAETHAIHQKEKSIEAVTSDGIRSNWELFMSGSRNLDQLLTDLSAVFGEDTVSVLRTSHAAIAPFLEYWYFWVKQAELIRKQKELEEYLQKCSFQAKKGVLRKKSLQMFHSRLADDYHIPDHAKSDELGNTIPFERKIFDARSLHSPPYKFDISALRELGPVESAAFLSALRGFNQEYPIILSTTHSLKKSLDPDHIYDYVIIDEASQVDLVSGALALSCARNVVIVGDLKQLPNIPPRQRKKADAAWSRFTLPAFYNYSTHSLLASAVERWKDAPSTLLREHYRCHPKIIGFCNQKFYDGKLLAMTVDKGEKDVLAIYATSPGTKVQNHLNQEQLDIISWQICPRLQKSYRDIGIIAPYREQVKAIRERLRRNDHVDTVHAFQGRENDAIILCTTDEEIGPFVDDPNLLNVAVSRAVRSLSVVMSLDACNDKTHYGDLARYIRYQNHAFGNDERLPVPLGIYQRTLRIARNYWEKNVPEERRGVTDRMCRALEKILDAPEFAGVGFTARVLLDHLVPSVNLLDDEERKYLRRLPGVHFLIFRKIDHIPLGAIRFNKAGSGRAADVKFTQMMSAILKKCGIPYLLLEPDQMEDSSRIADFLREILE